MAPAALSGVLRSESAPVSSTPGASVPVTAKSSDWRRKASWLEPKSTARLLLPERVRSVPAAASWGTRPVTGRVPGPGDTGATLAVLSLADSGAGCQV